MSGLAKKSFDYSIVDSDTKSDLIYFADRISKARDSIGKSTIEMGESLAAAQERLANHSGGTFVQWVETECGFSERTAYNLIYSYREFGSFANFAKLEDSAMYALASPSTPKKARTEAMKLADRGESITHAKAKEIIAKHKEKETRSDKGKPGGVGNASSTLTPVASGPATEATAADSGPYYCCSAEFGEHEPSCPNYSEDEEQPAETTRTETNSGNVSTDEAFAKQRAKTVKTLEAAMREFDALHGLRNRLDDHDWALNSLRALLQSAKSW